MDGAFTVEEMSFASNEVGHDWKTWTGAEYVIASDRCYFVQSQTGDVWRLFFTGYGGSATGDIEFGKILESGANVSEEIGMAQRLEVFPNPVAGPRHRHLEKRPSHPRHSLLEHGRKARPSPCSKFAVSFGKGLRIGIGALRGPSADIWGFF